MFKICTKAGETMISYEAIVQQIEKHVMQAKQGGSEARLREQLSAIHTLCEIVLHEKATHVNQPAASSTVQVHTLPASTVQSPVAIAATKLEEKDANGESLFDF